MELLHDRSGWARRACQVSVIRAAVVCQSLWNVFFDHCMTMRREVHSIPTCLVAFNELWMCATALSSSHVWERAFIPPPVSSDGSGPGEQRQQQQQLRLGGRLFRQLQEGGQELSARPRARRDRCASLSVCARHRLVYHHVCSSRPAAAAVPVARRAAAAASSALSGVPRGPAAAAPARWPSSPGPAPAAAAAARATSEHPAHQ